MKIKSLSARKILDSRGEWTDEAHIVFANGAQATASVPEGKSTGSHEAIALPAAVAAKKITSMIAPKVARREFNSQESFDNFLIKLDGTANKKRLGANAILATSIAFARASAVAKRVPLWQYIREAYGEPIPRARTDGSALARPRLFMNVVNGGMHAGNNLDFQEYLIIPKCRTFRESVEIGTQIYHALGTALARAKGKGATNVGDEGGYAPNFKDNLEPFHIIRAVVKKLRLEKFIDYGLDAAATDIKYRKPDELADLYAKLAHEKDFIYLEDPFAENSFEAFALLTARFGKNLWIAGDDLTTTNVRRMELAHAEQSVNAVIVKPNQIGSVTEALDAVRAARRYNWKVVVSHRSGETDDDFIADFAYGVGADGFKLGAPARGERVAKYNRLLAIEAENS